MFNTLRTLLLLVLFAVAGEALAAPCDSGSDHQAPGISHDAVNMPHKSMESIARHQQCADHGCNSRSELQTHHSCDSDCNCCPGVCTSVIPTSANPTELIGFSLPRTAYRSLDSSPEPETAIRPPILS